MIALANLPAALRKASACAALALAACATPPEPDVGAAAGGLYRVDPAHAIVSMWIGHLGLSRYPGRFADVSGALRFDPEDPTASRLEIEIPARSIDLPDKSLEATIRGEDWLDARTHPTIRFVSTAAERLDEATGRVTGDLTIRGVTRAVTLDVAYNGSAPNPFNRRETLGFSATGAIDRAAFGMTALPGFVGATIDLVIEIEFIAAG
ncbi:MAG: YceI family protein [Pseudomonadota bacterium]